MTEPQPILRPYRHEDRKIITELLSDLSSLYPKGGEWLIGRLIDVENGKAFCTVATSEDKIIGLAIETPKEKGVLKLSTIFIVEEFRGMGLGNLILGTLKNRWIEQGLERVIATYNITRMPTLENFFQINGFKQIAVEKDKYWTGQDEAVVEWKQSK